MVVDFGRLEIRVQRIEVNIQVLTIQILEQNNQQIFLQKEYSGNSGSQADVVFFFPHPLPGVF